MDKRLKVFETRMHGGIKYIFLPWYGDTKDKNAEPYQVTAISEFGISWGSFLSVDSALEYIRAPGNSPLAGENEPLFIRQAAF